MKSMLINKRPNLPKKMVINTFNKKDNPNGKGHCWHCGKKLVFKNRKKGLRGAWHMDHYPVVYRDIESQIFFGITEPNDPKNLVPACVNCNLSHKYEKSLWYCCNRSQCKCEICCSIKLVFLFIIIILLIFWLYKLI
jgi:hypothetical protein